MGSTWSYSCDLYRICLTWALSSEPYWVDLAWTLHSGMGRDGRPRTLRSEENRICSSWKNRCHSAWSSPRSQTRSCCAWTNRLRSCWDGHASTLSCGTCWVCSTRTLCDSSLWSRSSRCLSCWRHTMDYAWTLCNWEGELGLARSFSCQSCRIHSSKTSCSRACWILPVASSSCWSWVDQLYSTRSSCCWMSWYHSYKSLWSKDNWDDSTRALWSCSSVHRTCDYPSCVLQRIRTNDWERKISRFKWTWKQDCRWRSWGLTSRTMIRDFAKNILSNCHNCFNNSCRIKIGSSS